MNLIVKCKKNLLGGLAAGLVALTPTSASDYSQKKSEPSSIEQRQKNVIDFKNPACYEKSGIPGIVHVLDENGKRKSFYPDLFYPETTPLPIAKQIPETLPRTRQSTTLFPNPSFNPRAEDISPPPKPESDAKPASQPASQVQNPAEHEYINKIVSRLNLPEFPIAAVQMDLNSRRITNSGILKFQPNLELRIIKTKKDLELLANGIAKVYAPAYVNPRAFENFASHLEIDSNLAGEMEKTDAPTVYDVLAQFSNQYNASFCRGELQGLVPYKTKSGKTIVAGNYERIKSMKAREPSKDCLEKIKGIFSCKKYQGRK
jgi:hypothetical protein